MGIKKQTKEKETKKAVLPFITGLRGYAALMVFLTHTGNLYGINKPFFNQLTEIGKYGVVLFFVISAFTLCLSINQTEKFNFKKYIFRRFFRIAPLYFFISILCFIFAGTISGGGYYMNMFHIPRYDIFNLITHITFTNVFFQKYQNSLIGVEWTIPLEFLYYLFIPLLFFLTRKNPLFIFIVLLFGLFLINHPKIYFPIYFPKRESEGWGIERYVAIYSLGILSFFILFKNSLFTTFTLWKRFVGWISISIITIYLMSFSSLFEIKIIIASLILYIYSQYIKPVVANFFSNDKIKVFIKNTDTIFLLLIVYSYVRYAINFQNIFIAIFGVLTLVISFERSIITKFLLENVVIMHIGKISYSFYLWHLIVIVLAANYGLLSGVLRVIIVFAVTITISTITQKYIEEPFMNGRAFAFFYERFNK